MRAPISATREPYHPHPNCIIRTLTLTLTLTLTHTQIYAHTHRRTSRTSGARGGRGSRGLGFARSAGRTGMRRFVRHGLDLSHETGSSRDDGGPEVL